MYRASTKSCKLNLIQISILGFKQKQCNLNVLVPVTTHKFTQIIQLLLIPKICILSAQIWMNIHTQCECGHLKRIIQPICCAHCANQHWHFYDVYLCSEFSEWRIICNSPGYEQQPYISSKACCPYWTPHLSNNVSGWSKHEIHQRKFIKIQYFYEYISIKQAPYMCFAFILF